MFTLYSLRAPRFQMLINVILQIKYKVYCEVEEGKL